MLGIKPKSFTKARKSLYQHSQALRITPKILERCCYCCCCLLICLFFLKVWNYLSTLHFFSFCPSQLSSGSCRLWMPQRRQDSPRFSSIKSAIFNWIITSTKGFLLALEDKPCCCLTPRAWSALQVKFTPTIMAPNTCPCLKEPFCLKLSWSNPQPSFAWA